MKWKVIIEAVERTDWLVDADTEEEANEKAMNNDGKKLRQRWESCETVLAEIYK